MYFNRGTDYIVSYSRGLGEQRMHGRILFATEKTEETEKFILRYLSYLMFHQSAPRARWDCSYRLLQTANVFRNEKNQNVQDISFQLLKAQKVPNRFRPVGEFVPADSSRQKQDWSNPFPGRIAQRESSRD